MASTSAERVHLPTRRSDLPTVEPPHRASWRGFTLKVDKLPIFLILCYNTQVVPRWWNWHTQLTGNEPGPAHCGFNSRPGHLAIDKCGTNVLQ